jgi:hypothetical protein
MTNHPHVTALERAFDLASSRACNSTADIRKCLVAEGYDASQLCGPTLLRQLRGLMVTTSSEPSQRRQRAD